MNIFEKAAVACIVVGMGSFSVWQLSTLVINRNASVAQLQASKKLVDCLNRGMPLYYSDKAPPFKVQAEAGSAAISISDEQPSEKGCLGLKGRSRCNINFATYDVQDGKVNQYGILWDNMSPSIDRAFLTRSLNHRIGVCRVGYAYPVNPR